MKYASLLILGASLLRADADLAIEETDAAIVVTRDGKPVLTYHKAEVPPPEGASPLYRRSGFIHPVHAPSGGVVTSVHASDHVHHMGLWHAWVNTEHDGRKQDFWNLKKGEATVGYAKTLKIRDGKDVVGFTVLQHHSTLDPKRTVLEEKFTVTVRHSNGAHVIDYDTVQTNVTEHPLKFPAYRYGGPIAYRAPLDWKEANSDYLTSEGKTRTDGHTTRARWVAMFGPTENGDATLAILCHPENRDAPQRTRIWPATKKNHGHIFFNYVPIQEKPWALKPREPSTMRYRVIVADGKPDARKLDQRWEDYAK